ncbi:MAG: TetR/AcrR family transcriptional regulator [Alphaproteobacteria bacterium]|nr:TetR/AcrR family transcriptional regulator [Alphaproteobacteria bacterium]
MTKSEDRQSAQRIVEAAVALAEQRSWESVRLHEVAAHLGIRLDDIRRHFREKDELIDAWFDRADDAVLALADSGVLTSLSPRERLFELIMAWLGALEHHRRVTRQMIGNKLEPGHLHIQVPAVMRISRTVQWIREAALLEDAGVRRAFTETGVTAIYLAAFVRWLGEDTAGSPRTRGLLDRMLRRAEGLMKLLPIFAGGRVTPSTTREETRRPPAWTP